LVVPISVRGEILGAFGVYSAKKDRFTEKDEALLMAIGSQTGVAVENARLYEQTLDLARMDGLTCMFNRRYLMECLAQEIDRAERYQNSLSLMILDMDKFKSFNDAYGHVKGDELLKAFSSILKDAVRTSDIAGRYGGEEFCIVLPNTSIKGAALIAERIRKAVEGLAIPVAEGQPAAGRTVSVGVAEFSSGDSLEKLLAAADAALYRAKDGGRNRVEISKD
jgi:diguanylate cyclase (GGDEF)-like protein